MQRTRIPEVLIPALALGLWLAGYAVPGWGDNREVTVQVQLDAGEVYVGVPLPLKIQVRAPAGMPVSFPDWEHIETPWTLRSASELLSTSENGTVLHEQTVLLSILGTGNQQFPPQAIHYGEGAGSSEVWSEAISVTVASRLSGEDTDLRDILPPRLPPEPFPWRQLIWPAALLLLAAAIFFAARRLRSGRAAALVLEAVPPWEVALQALRQLDQQTVFQEGQSKARISELSAILRIYLADRFGLMAPERTTEEFTRILASHPDLDTGHKEWLGAFLAFCDLVKFAKLTFGSREWQSRMREVIDFVRGTIPSPEEAKST